MRQAFAALRSGRPQPVMVELVEDALVGEVSGDVAEYTPVPWIRPGPDAGGVREAADLLLRAERPLIWSGHGTLYAEASAEFQAGRGAPGRADAHDAHGQERLRRAA